MVSASKPIGDWAIKERPLGVPVGEHAAAQPEQQQRQELQRGGDAERARRCRAVRSSTSQSWAVRCIQVPTLETTLPVANSR